MKIDWDSPQRKLDDKLLKGKSLSSILTTVSKTERVSDSPGRGRATRTKYQVYDLMSSRPPESGSVQMSEKMATSLETTLRGAMESYNFSYRSSLPSSASLATRAAAPWMTPIGPVPTTLLEGSGESRRSVAFIHCHGVHKKEGILRGNMTLKRARIQGPPQYVSPFHITRLTELTIFFRPFPAEEETLRSPQETRGFSEVAAFPLA